MNGFLLVIIIGLSTSQSGASTIVYSFSNSEKCETAKVKILTDLGRMRSGGAVVQSANCHPL